MVLPHILRQVLGDQAPPVIFVDTGFYPQETLIQLFRMAEAGYPIEYR